MSDDAPPDVEDAEGGDPGAENGTGLQAALAGLPAGDRKLLWAFILASLFTLGLGVLYALVLVMVKGGFIELESTLAYTVLTLHATTVFYYWLYFVQVAMVYVFVLAYTEGVKRLAWRPLAWLGFGLMSAGFLMDQAAPWLGAAITYEGLAPLSEGMEGSDWFYLGYVLLGLGLLCVSLPCIVTPLMAKWEGRVENWSSITFAATLWAALLTVTQFLLDRFHLLIEIIFALGALHLVLHPAFDALFNLQNRHFALHQRIDLFQPLLDRQGFQKFLFLVHVNAQMAGHQIGELGRLASLGHRRHCFFGDVFLEIGRAHV